MTRPVLIAAGGTGGHIFPALAVAEVLRAANIPVIWVGTRRGMEARTVPAAGLPIEWLQVGGLRGKGWSTRLAAPFVLLRACLQALVLVRRHRPQVMLGMGGFVAGPAGVAAWLSRCPLVIHEQNAVAGLTNRLLARFAVRVLEAIPDTFPSHCRATAVGNPVRAAIAALPAPEERFAGREGPPRLLVLGGSQGARVLNEQVPAALARLPVDRRPLVRHQSGMQHLEGAREAYAAARVEAEVVPFIDDMAQAYEWTDLVIARSGAMTVAEVAAAGIGALFVPFPHAVDDHQAVNAHWLVDAGAAEMLREEELDDVSLAAALADLLDRRVLLERAQRARERAFPDAAVSIARILQEVAR